MTFCPWCQTSHNDEDFCDECGYCLGMCDCDAAFDDEEED